MDKFKEFGIYLRMNDLKQNGYFTKGQDGNLSHHKYKLSDKLFDIYKYGKTVDINYSYIFLYKPPSDAADLDLYMGTRADELPEILSSFQLFSPLAMERHKIDCKIVSSNEIKYIDGNNRECTIRAIKEGMSITLENYNFNDGTFKSTQYNYYPLPI